MLSYRLLKNHAGIMLIGDYTSLRWLHEVVHDVNERSPLVRDRESMFIGLAYDVRKAYERQREILEPPEHYEELGIRYGVKILWPVLLLQQRMLRSSLGYLDHATKTQAIAYRRCVRGRRRARPARALLSLVRASGRRGRAGCNRHRHRPAECR